MRLKWLPYINLEFLNWPYDAKSLSFCLRVSPSTEESAWLTYVTTLHFCTSIVDWDVSVVSSVTLPGSKYAMTLVRSCLIFQKDCSCRSDQFLFWKHRAVNDDLLIFLIGCEVDLISCIQHPELHHVQLVSCQRQSHCHWCWEHQGYFGADLNWMVFWKISLAEFVPKLSLWYLNSPLCVANVVMCWLSGARGWRCSLENTVASLRV